MEAIANYINSLGINFDSFWQAGLILLLGTFLLSAVGHFVFGKRSLLNHAVSSAIAVLFIYAASIVLSTTGAEFQHLIAPLPFLNINGDQVILFSFENAHYTAICSEVLSMIILSFLVNLADGWLPSGKNVLSWFFFRCLTVVIAYLLHLLVVGLFVTYLPEGIVMYAPVILLALLILLLLTGVLKIIIGALLATVNPIIGGLYTFFFANVIGKQITKAMLTAAIISGIIVALQYVGFAVISIASAALIAYIPFLLILIVLWYIAMKIF